MAKANQAVLEVVEETSHQKIVTQGVKDARTGYGQGQTKLAVEMLIMYHGLSDKSLWIGSGQGRGAGEAFEQINGKMKSAIAGGEISVSLVGSTWRAALECEQLTKPENGKPIVVVNQESESITIDVARLKRKASNGLVISFHKSNGNSSKTTRGKRIKTLKTTVRDMLDKIKPEATKKTPNNKALTKTERADLLWMQERIALALGNKVVTSDD